MAFFEGSHLYDHACIADHDRSMCLWHFCGLMPTDTGSLCCPLWLSSCPGWCRWPFATLQQQILRASVADVSGTGITNDDITFISASLESTQARRHRRALLQGTLQALNVTFQIQTNGTQAAKAIADQLYAATKSGVLAVGALWNHRALRH